MVPSFTKKVLPNAIQQHPILKRQSDGLTMAFVETWILCSFERLKVFRMTQSEDNKLNYSDFMKRNNQNLVSQLFKGFKSMFLKTFMQWTVFLQSDNLIKSVIRKRWNLNESEVLSNSQLAIWIVFVSITNILFVTPIDVVKTQLQQIENVACYSQAIKAIYNNSGVMGFLSGSRVRMIQCLINALFIVTFIEKFKLSIKE